ncbi:MAG: cytochrome c biogenesis protein DipZ [Candidatus Omnitrophica bacterium]|nr:cytochrome c biogenesis protein DipZ [Candidatus Omnitrophota bacterium]
MPVLLFFTFIAGIVTIMAPCIWPLLPIVLSVSSGGGRRRPLGITLGIMTSFTIFTLSISYLEKFLHIDPNVFRTIAVIILVLLGLSMMIPSLGIRFEELINRLLAPFQSGIKKQGTGFLAGYAMGFSTGLVWAPCSGPILATIATLAATQSVNIKVVMVTLAYVSGLGIPLFLLGLAGSRFFNIMRRFTKYTARIQQAFGLVIIAAALLIYTNYDKNIQLKILNLFPSYGKFLSGVENNAQVTKELGILKGHKADKREVRVHKGLLPDLGQAPEFAGIYKWLNTPAPLSMRQLRGKVVLVDFWTYTCINCIRTLPHVTAWYEKYKNNNLIVIGVHTPEFAFEKNTKNVEAAIRQFKINYPVAQDNDYRTWRAFDNSYWPADYLIDAKGRIRSVHFGEGNYEETERNIRALLEESGSPVAAAVSSLKDRTPRYRLTPETYLGMARMERFASPERVSGGTQAFTLPLFIPPNYFAYQGAWNLSEESAEAEKGSALEINFLADKVFLVISPHAKGDKVRVLLDGKPVDDSRAGTDVKNNVVTLDEQRLYGLIDLRGIIQSHLLRLEFEDGGISVYAFTFG